MEYITRTFTRTVATLGAIDNYLEGNPIVKIIGNFEAVGELDKAKMLKLAKKTYPDVDTLCVTKLETVTELRGMPVTKFVESSVLMENPRTPKTNETVTAIAETN